MEYKERTYREHFRTGRWSCFTLKYKETDVWIGVDKASFRPDMPGYCQEVIRRLRTSMEEYIAADPRYLTALEPYNARETAPEILKQMSAAAFRTGIGPMSAVAGAVAFHIVEALKEKYRIREGIVENGGDIYADIREDMDISVFAGASPLSEKVGLHIDAREAPLGICTSSGTVGPSLSFGKADAVMISCKDVLLADSYATRLANLIREPEDIPPVLEQIKNTGDILAALIIQGDKMGVIGKFEIKFFN